MQRPAERQGSIHSPPDGVPARPPTSTRAQQLPFGDLTWENFERLCHRLAGLSAAVEFCARYGRPGQAQRGIDVYARRVDGTYDTWQAKRHRSFGASQVKKAVGEFIKGDWKERSHSLILAVQAPLDDTQVQEEIERQAARLKADGIIFTALGADQLTEMLRSHPAIVDDFFGRPWAEAILGTEVARGLGERLDGRDFATAREQLLSFYENRFRHVDPGVTALPTQGEQYAALAILDRFTAPDVLIRQPSVRAERVRPQELDADIKSLNDLQGAPRERGAAALREERLTRRVRLVDWLADGDRLAVVGDAGLGKSTLLRCIALDLLKEQSHFPALAERWGGRLPIHVPFARWAREVAKEGEIGLKEIVRGVLQPFLTTDLVMLIDRAIDEHRVLLLVDGLDEWANEQAARTAFHGLLTLVDAHSIPIVVTGRPLGLSRIGTVPADWRSATLAPLSAEQQRRLAARWFAHYGDADPCSEPLDPHVEARTDRFMAELARDRSLSTLAEVPLLLMGLVALSLRQVVLPRSKDKAYDRLVELLLEEHPNWRATASGDGKDRFRFAGNAEQRRSAIARLAFAIRSEGGDAGYPRKKAKRLIQDFLSSEEGFDLGAALAAAEEILAVNSETQGLIVEKAPKEIGFAHASFEEFLTAQHIAEWPFNRVREFVDAHAGTPRWRNVIINLLAVINRRNEVDELIAVIERDPVDPLAALYRRGLLAEAAFASSTKSPSTLGRLTKLAFDEIELGDWFPARRDALSSALTGLGDAVLGPLVADKMRGWTPKRASYRTALLEALGGWSPSADLLEVLWRSMHDEDRGSQRSAAQALARVYGGDAEVGARLQRTAAGTKRLAVAAAVLEALVAGWDGCEELSALYDQAAGSLDSAVRLLGIHGRLSRGSPRSDRDRDDLVEMLPFSSDLDYAYEPLALHLLIKNWPDDPELIASALDGAAKSGHRETWEREDAVNYLLACSPHNESIRRWAKEELRDRYPFNIMARRDVWDGVGRLAVADREIAELAVVHLCGDEARYFNHQVPPFVVHWPDGRLKAKFLDDVRGKKDFSRYWSCRALMSGWGTADPDVAQLFADIGTWSDDRLDDLVSLLPSIIEDSEACRTRLLSIGRSVERIRTDLLASGLAQTGADGRDDEAVQVLLGTMGANPPVFRGAAEVFRSFSAHPTIRELAVRTLSQVDPELHALATGFSADNEIRSLVLQAAAPLPVDLRTFIAEAAIADAATPPFSSILAGYDLETDAELKVRLSVGYHRHLVREGRASERIDALLEGLKVVGPDHQERRAAALGALLVCGESTRLPHISDEFGSLKLTLGSSSLTPMHTMHEVVCEHWADLRAAFGDELSSRFDPFGSSGGELREGMAPFLTRSEAAKQEFLVRCEDPDMILGPKQLRALARERPKSELLLSHLWRSLERTDQQVGRSHDAGADVARLLLEHFPDQPEVSERLNQSFLKVRNSDAAIALAIYAPRHPSLLGLTITPLEIARDHGQWAAALSIARGISTSEEFASLTLAMVTRTKPNRWDLQSISNAAVTQRLREDPAVAQALLAELRPRANPSVIASVSRYLSHSTSVGDRLGDVCGELLRIALRGDQIVEAGYDALADRIRSVPISLLYALHAGGEA